MADDFTGGELLCDGPVIFGKTPADLTRNTIAMIRKNAGKGSDARLDRVAKQHNIDLTYRVEKEPEPRGA